MNISKELLEKAKTAKSEEELLAMAKAEKVELTEEEAAKAFAELHKMGELSDAELDNVAGGCAGPYQSGDTPLFNSGDRVKYRKNIRYANCGDFGFNESENRVDTIFDYCKEDGVFIYRMRCGDLIKEYDVMEKA